MLAAPTERRTVAFRVGLLFEVHTGAETRATGRSVGAGLLRCKALFFDDSSGLKEVVAVWPGERRVGEGVDSRVGERRSPLRPLMGAPGASLGGSVGEGVSWRRGWGAGDGMLVLGQGKVLLHNSM